MTLTYHSSQELPIQENDICYHQSAVFVSLFGIPLPRGYTRHGSLALPRRYSIYCTSEYVILVCATSTSVARDGLHRNQLLLYDMSIRAVRCYTDGITLLNILVLVITSVVYVCTFCIRFSTYYIYFNVCCKHVYQITNIVYYIIYHCWTCIVLLKCSFCCFVTKLNKVFY